MQHESSNVVANVLPDPHPIPPDPGVEVKRSKFHFSEHGDVTYQIKGNHECSNMVTNILQADPHPDPGDGVNGNGQLFQNMVMLHIKLKGMANSATCKHISCICTHPGLGSNGYKHFSESSHISYQINGNRTSRMQQYGSKYFAHRPNQ